MSPFGILLTTEVEKLSGSDAASRKRNSPPGTIVLNPGCRGDLVHPNATNPPPPSSSDTSTPYGEAGRLPLTHQAWIVAHKMIRIRGMVLARTHYKTCCTAHGSNKPSFNTLKQVNIMRIDRQRQQ
eukprot:5761013-Amphidinium_carterae.1